MQKLLGAEPWASLFLLCLHFALKLTGVGFNDIALDEPFTLFHAQMSLEGIVEMLPRENNPPLHFFFMHYWVNWFGLEPWVVRLPSVVFSSFCGWVIFRIGVRHFTPFVGWVASLLFAFSTFQLVFAHEARAYALLVLLSAIALYFFLGWLKSPGSRQKQLLLLFVNGLLLYTHFMGFFVVFVQGFVLFALKPLRKQLFKPALLGIGGLALIYLPYIFVFLTRVDSASEGTWLEPPGWAAFYNFIRTILNQPVVAVLALVVLYLGFGAAGIRRQAIARESSVLLLWFFVPLVLAFLVSFWIPVFLSKYLIFLTPAFYLLLAISITHLFQKRRLQYLTASVLLLAMATTVNLKPDNQRDLEQMVFFVKELRQSTETPIYLCPPWVDVAFAYHYNRTIFEDVQNFSSHMTEQQVYAIYGEQDVGEIQAASLIYIDASGQILDYSGSILAHFQKEFSNVMIYDQFSGFIVYYFNGKTLR